MDHTPDSRSFWQTLFAALKGEEIDYTQGNINRAILLLAIPMILEMSMEALFAVVDAYWAGRISTDAVAAIGLTESVITLVYAVAIGLSMAATSMVARRIGERRIEAARMAAMQSIWLGIILSILLGIIGALFAEDILRLMGGDAELIRENVGYTRILFSTNIVILLLFLLNGIFRGAGDAFMAMYSLWIANILNIILDPILIFGWGPVPAYGVEGAAIATSIGRGIGVLFQLIILVKGASTIKLGRKHLRWVYDTIKELIKVGAGGAGQYIVSSASWMIMMAFVAYFGTDTVAGYVFAIRVIIFTILPSWGIANAAATLVGQNLGAGQPERAETSAWRTAFYSMLFLLAVSMLFFTAAPWVIGIFTDNEKVIRSGVQALRIICAGYVFFGYGMVIGQAFNGAGDTITPTWINFICLWIIQIPLAYVLSRYTELEESGIYWSVAICESLLALALIWRFRLGHWKQHKI